MKTVAFHTLGCKVNQYDTQAMLELFRAAGYTVVPFQDHADIYVLNTCTVTGTGDRKSMQIARSIRKHHPESELILCGCLAQRKGEALLDTGARLILGTQRRTEVVTLLEQAVRCQTQICAVDGWDRTTRFESLNIADQEEHTRAVFKIQEGCNNHCTYCIIPSVRGPIRSRALEDIALEAARLADAGYRELVVIGIHLTSYGNDLSDHPTLLSAIETIQNTPGIQRIRLGSLEPVIATKSFARELSSMDKVCPQFHLALQSGSDSVLKRMARRYQTKQYMDSVNAMREFFPDMALTTDILTGFPGESEEEYRQTCDFIRQVGFARIHVFPYSPREGTKAAMMPGQLTREQKEHRVRELIALGNEMSKNYRKRWLNRTVCVLPETRDSSGNWFGYTPEYIYVSIPDCPAIRQGIPVTVQLTGLSDTGMYGIIPQI